ncbi:amino acid ABC transporter permease [Desulfohalobium retbaense]|uniref:Polar amino acid ABC transporter, inner membrane subunit n=1 Tax=Desulfohalobium retbaense (strain ATCC 49708 / DSM 5692 / JCM 16813 / HR100) TaxID=485915 RepID=C8X440_DESRD|nr:amino acid ABC transporter permease [Desulfohalobium retbaense]ACV69314.1 polar amino acid ABC transporter, inner membrane subunit [Desulfohalobium retbaense DSM 5692]
MSTLRYVLEKSWAQYLVLFLLVGTAIYYWGWIFDFGYEFDWSVLFTFNDTYGEYLGLNLLKGLKVTIIISLISAGIALGLGTVFGLGRLSSFKPFYLFSTWYVEFFRNTPLLVQLFFWYFALPKALPEAARNFVFSLDYEFWSATLGLAIYTSSFMAEVIRAGVQSIPKGLLEAAYSSGLTYFQALRTVILPLAFRAIIPPLGSEFLNNMKNSSLAMVVGVAELTWQSQQIESLTFRGFEATTGATVLYLGLSLAISGLLNMINTRLRIEDVHKKGGLTYHLTGALFWPFTQIWKLGILPVCKLCAPPADSLRMSPGRRMWETAKKSLFQAMAWLAKGGFVLVFLYILYKIGQGLMSFHWDVVWENLDTLLIWRFPQSGGGEENFMWGLGGLSFSILMAVIAISISFFIGLIVGLGRMSKNRILRLPCMVYIEVIRGNPLIIVIFWVYFFLPIFIKTYLNVFWSATIALTIFTGAYIAEIVRGGIQNIPPGQFEAAYGTGLGYWSTMRHIVLPQALKQMIPAIVGQFIAIFKDTSLAFVIGVLELTFVAQGLNNRLMIYPFEIYTSVAALYFICCYSMSLMARRLENKLTPASARMQM